ncbi:HhH-GPD-type base excision DNA repair protein [Lipingzhangella sp. LS1_29]|uniref:HhH-GPD-type base excision DNA repair protein n=1 Tax=Lipingzhangella rawalii TaxID=2055835 RepID=A0ABU2H216_9ACTN|nr:HhH-GPD-type base excision DNA repair protein [Lipingzhangella rawalii]MDS1269042.1 HhH-GPD-type base excision DNA repair protein [Lipingzhangella rawalii]
MTPALHLTGDAEADQLLSETPLALLMGSLLDQQVAMETAFAGPKKIAERLGHLDLWQIAEMPEEDFTAVCAQKPAVHRFPGAMAKRLQALCRYLADTYDGNAAGIWTDGSPDGAEVLRRLRALPGFGEQKAQIFVALLGKQLGVQPAGWREAAGPYGQEDARLSIADVVDRQTLQEVRSAKRQAKQKTSGR